MDLTRLKGIEKADVAGRRVLIRVDINVPLQDGNVTDDTRIAAIVPTVRDVLDRGGSPILMAHLGRPKGKAVPELSLKVLQEPLSGALGASVIFASDGGSKSPGDRAAALEPGEVLLLENVRFDPGEEANDPAFARALSALGDIYVNDAFSCAHRAHASTEGIARLLPAYAGIQMLAELNALGAALQSPRRPVAALVGGAKVSTKIPVLTHLVERVDKLIIGGGMANTFLAADGREIGSSLAEPDLTDSVREIRQSAGRAGCEIILPVDVVAADGFAADSPHASYPVEGVPSDRMILDIGPRSVEDLSEHLASCRTLLWNGPLGAFEIAPFGKGTFAVAETAARLTDEKRLVTVAGGGDTVAALNGAGVADRFSYVSTAGGAFLEFLEGRELPGVAVLLR